MKRLTLLIPIFLIGCSSERTIEIEDYGTNHYFIPDSNKQKYLDFISKASSGCMKDCSDMYWRVKQTAGEMYGSRQYTVIETSGPFYDRNRIVKELAPEEMNDRQLEYFKKYFQ